MLPFTSDRRLNDALSPRLVRCHVWLFLATITVCLLVGCRNRVDWGPPGTIGQQRARAQIHDPYPSPDLGPPIVSGRPHGFERPASEPNRLQRDNPFSRRNQASQPFATDPFPGFAPPPMPAGPGGFPGY